MCNLWARWLVPVRSARTIPTRSKALRAAFCGSAAVAIVFFGAEFAAKRDRQRRHPHHFLPSHPSQGRHHHHLQGERPVRPRGDEEGQSRAARLADRPAHQHGPPPDRRPLGGLPGHRRAGADPRDRRLPFARHQRHAAPPLQRGRAPQPAHARQGDRLLHPGRASSRRSARLGSGCSAAASASIRRRARRSCTWMSAACATGRGSRRRSSRASWPRAR